MSDETPTIAFRRFKRSLRIVSAACVVIAVSLAVWCYSVRSNAEATLARAKWLIAEERWNEARASLNNLLRFKPKDTEAVYLIGQILQLNGELNAAAETYSRVPVSSKEHRQASLARGVALLDDAQFVSAENAFRDHLELYPESTQARNEVKWLLFNQFRERELENFLKGQLAIHPEDRALLVDLLFIGIRQQVPRETMGHLAEVNESKPGQANVVLALAQCFWKTAQMQTATDFIRQALQLRPNHLETRLVAAEFQMEQGQPDSAANLLSIPESISGVKRKDWQDDDRWCWLSSRLALLRGDDKTAEALATRALKLRPNERKYVHGYQALLSRTGQSEAAETFLKQAAELQNCKNRLEALVSGGELDDPTVETCREVATLARACGETEQAAGWDRLADLLQNSDSNGATEN